MEQLIYLFGKSFLQFLERELEQKPNFRLDFEAKGNFWMTDQKVPLEEMSIFERLGFCNWLLHGGFMKKVIPALLLAGFFTACSDNDRSDPSYVPTPAVTDESRLSGTSSDSEEDAEETTKKPKF